jgi:hypothetical protein
MLAGNWDRTSPVSAYFVHQVEPEQDTGWAAQHNKSIYSANLMDGLLAQDSVAQVAMYVHVLILPATLENTQNNTYEQKNAYSLLACLVI